MRASLSLLWKGDGGRHRPAASRSDVGRGVLLLLLLAFGVQVGALSGGVVGWRVAQVADG